MDIEALKAFLAVATAKSFSNAAERLFLTQSAISKRIATLEAELGVPLFNRMGRQILLTDAGLVLLPKARHILEEVSESRRLIANLSRNVSGPLRLVTSHHIGLHRLPSALRDYKRQYPLVELDIQFMDSETACRAVADGTFELGVVTLPDPPIERLRQTTIWTDYLQIVVASDHPIAKPSNTDLEQLSLTPAILPEGGTITREIIEKPFREQQLNLNIVLETNYLETIRMMVSVGMGWSALPATMHDSDLTVLKVPFLEPTRRLGIVAHKQRTSSNAAKAFEKLLLENQE